MSQRPLWKVEEAKIVSKSEAFSIFSLSIDHQGFFLHAYLQDGEWKPRQLFHTQTSFDDCPMCSMKRLSPICSSSHERQAALLQILLDRRDIRLRWLFD